VFTLVKKLPPGCKAILTSRRRIGSGAEELILEKLSGEAALATLAKLAESNHALAKTSEAIALVRQNKKSEALRYVRRAVDIFTRIGSPNVAHARRNLAECES